MKRILLLATFCLFIAALLSSFQPDKVASFSPAAEVKAEFLKDLNDFQRACDRLSQITTILDDQSLPLAREAFIDARYAFKSIEFLATYLDAEFVDNYINGAPLLSLEPNAPQLSIVEPEGFQTLEEVLFSEVALQQQSDIQELSAALSENARELSFLKQVYLTDRQVIEAARFELIRVFTLGVTGFDSPVLSNSLPEAVKALQAVRDAVVLYLPLVQAKDTELAGRIQSTFQAVTQYLDQNTNFESFDRLEFLTEFINPLYKDLLEAQLALQIETYYETSSPLQKHAVNYFADNIFADDFLNPFYYTRMPSQEYSLNTIRLGRTLFFDPILSQNNERACASCHQPEKAFTDGVAKSLASNNQGTVERNAPTLLNAVYADRFFYDLRSDVLEDQMDHVIFDHREFHTNYLAIFDKLSQSTEYQTLFQEAFPEIDEQPINKYTLTTALAAYVTSLKSFNSPFDQYVRGERDSLSASVARGFNLFMGKAACGTCHFAPTFNGLVPPLFHESESEVLGVPKTNDTTQLTLDTDLGRATGVLKEYVDFYKHSFKTTTVRNAALTAPYMHNGVYQTLEEVVDFYNRGGGAGMGLDVPYQTLPSDPLDLTAQEQQDIIAFMESLTDTTQVNHLPKKLPNFANREEWNNRPIGGSY